MFSLYITAKRLGIFQTKKSLYELEKKPKSLLRLFYLFVEPVKIRYFRYKVRDCSKFFPSFCQFNASFCYGLISFFGRFMDPKLQSIFPNVGK